jgi:hypothetical protein
MFPTPHARARERTDFHHAPDKPSLAQQWGVAGRSAGHAHASTTKHFASSGVGVDCIK